MDKKKLILIVDDDRLVALSMEDLLKKAGYDTYMTNSAEEAFELLSDRKFDLVISDLVMKEMHGLGLLARVKEVSSNTPVIVVTGFASVKSAIEALRLGAVDYLIKPCEDEELLLRVKRAFEKCEMECQLVEAQKKAMFTATVITANHEINQPLTAILGGCGLIEMEMEEVKLENKTISKQLNNISKSAQRISSILWRMKEISRPIFKSYAENIQMVHLGEKVVEQPAKIEVASMPHAKSDDVILIVDDEKDIREVMTDMLGRLRYRTFKACDGQEALEIFQQYHSEVDLVITDMKMPHMSGKELYCKLKEIDSSVKIILSSGYDVENDVNELQNQGVSGFLRKPFNIEQLTTAVAQALK